MAKRGNIVLENKGLRMRIIINWLPKKAGGIFSSSSVHRFDSKPLPFCLYSCCHASWVTSHKQALSSYKAMSAINLLVLPISFLLSLFYVLLVALLLRLCRQPIVVRTPLLGIIVNIAFMVAILENMFRKQIFCLGSINVFDLRKKRFLVCEQQNLPPQHCFLV